MKEPQVQKKNQDKYEMSQEDRNDCYYTGDIEASKLHKPLSSHHRTDGEGVHIPVM